MATVGRAARSTGLKKPRPLKRLMEPEIRNETTRDSELDNKVKNLNLNDNDRQTNSEENNNITTSFTAIMDIGSEKLVLASTSMKLILKTASMISLHMDGEILHLDEDSINPNLESGDNKNIRAQQESPKSTRKSHRPTREQLKPLMPEVPHMICKGMDTQTHNFLEEESDVERRYVDTHCESSMPVPAHNCYQYSVKDLLMMSRYPHSKIKPRNWRLIRDAFPELVSNEERYFEPFDLKGCSPHALLHSKGHSEHQDLNNTTPYSFYNARKLDRSFSQE